MIGCLAHHRINGTMSTLAPVVAFGVLGLIGLAYPQPFGSGKDMAHDVFLGGGSLGLLLALVILKPAVTALCVASRASGGLFTPVMSTGAVIGGAPTVTPVGRHGGGRVRACRVCPGA